MFDDTLIKLASKGDIPALATLDKMGFIFGEDEGLKDYIKRLKCLRSNVKKLDESLLSKGFFEFEDLRMDNADLIPKELFTTPAKITEKLFDFKVNWVPGFFVNPNFSWFFGGCAYFFFPDFFAFFIIRKSFSNKEKWLIYSRNELLSHELCHVARIGMQKRDFEEYFAYRTATSSFRKYIGSVFYSATDTFLLLGVTLTLLIAQVCRVILGMNIPIWPFWLLLGGCIMKFILRYKKIMRIIGKAKSTISYIFKEKIDSILFRCTCDEIYDLAKLCHKDDALKWFDIKQKNDLKWKVIFYSFYEKE